MPKNTAACTTASTIPPVSLPITSANREMGATKTPCRKPSRRSSIIEIVEKIAVNIKINTAMPGKKNS